MKETWNIQDIEALTEAEVRGMTKDSIKIKDHDIFFVNLGGYFGYSCLVFKNGRHIRHANDYQLHHGHLFEHELRDYYIKRMNRILFTEEEIAGPIADYEEYKRKKHFLHNYYGMQRDSISIFHISRDKEDEEDFKNRTKNMFLNPVSFSYMEDMDFIEKHIGLLKALKKASEAMTDDYGYQKSAFLNEMFNHEYGYSFDGDYAVLSAFGNIAYRDCSLENYFDELNFTDLQRRAYMDARESYYKLSA